MYIYVFLKRVAFCGLTPDCNCRSGDFAFIFRGAEGAPTTKAACAALGMTMPVLSTQEAYDVSALLQSSTRARSRKKFVMFFKCLLY